MSISYSRLPNSVADAKYSFYIKSVTDEFEEIFRDVQVNIAFEERVNSEPKANERSRTGDVIMIIIYINRYIMTNMLTAPPAPKDFLNTIKFELSKAKDLL